MAVIDFIRSEPALVGGLLSIVATLVLTLTHNDAGVGAILSAVEAAVALVVRSQVTPTIKLAQPH